VRRVFSHRLWTERFGSAPDVVGKTISLSGDTHTIVGVLGPFNFEDFGPSESMA
jgi:putative ABC transport system permease protein